MPRRAGGFRRERSGATAVEFAMILPVLSAMAFGAMALVLALLEWNALEEVTGESARCLAIGSALCGSPPEGCSAGAGPCFVLRLASERGLSGMGADQIAVDPALVVDGVRYTAVSIAHPFRLLGFEMMLTSINRYPNAG